MLLKGAIISGEFDEHVNEFSLQKVKHFNIESTIKESQLKSLYDYLKKHQDDIVASSTFLNSSTNPIWIQYGSSFSFA